MNKKSPQLKPLLNRLFYKLEKESIKYCVIGNYINLPEFTSNDVDFWVGDIDKAEEILMESAKEIGLSLYMQNKTANGTNNYFYDPCSKGVEIVKIDLMTETAYKSIFPIVSSNLIANNIEEYNGFNVANETIEGVMHLLYPLVAFGIVKDKYKDKLLILADDNLFREQVLSILGVELGQSVLNKLKKGDWKGVELNYKKVRRYLIFRTFIKIDFKRLMTFSSFFSSIVKRVFSKNGIVVSFTGIDGAGKTSIKEYLMKNSDKYFSKNRRVEFYWRPFLLPRLSKLVKMEGQKEVYNESGRRLVSQNKASIFKGMIKYCYYILDFIFGKIKYFKESHTGGLVIFDRYHFDNIVYPERFGFSINKSLMRFMDKFIIPQPDILFYFTADTLVLYERKHEIDIDVINAQKKMYSEEINLRKNVITIDTGVTFDESVGNVLKECFRAMSKRYEN